MCVCACVLPCVWQWGRVDGQTQLLNVSACSYKGVDGRVTLLEGGVKQSVEAFATSISAQEGRVRESIATFAVDSTNGGINYSGRGLDALLSRRELEFDNWVEHSEVDEIVTVGAETNTISVWGLVGNDLDLRDRRCTYTAVFAHSTALN